MRGNITLIGGNNMTVKQLISFLQDIENKDLPIFIYQDHDIILLKKDMIDLTIDDRIDINLPFEF